MPVRTVVYAAAVAVVATLLLAMPSSAAPGDCLREGTKVVNGQVITVCLEYEGGGTTPGTGDGGGEPDVCDLTVPGSLFNDFCIGTARCFINDPAAVQDTAENGLSEESKPNPDSHAVFWRCQRPDLTEFERYYWNDDQPTVTIQDRIRAAIGILQLPTITASYNPPNRTLVNLPTWWWAQGAPAGEIVGTPALGLRAVAVPRGLRVDPGDGSGPMVCPISVTQSDTCTYEYLRAGDYTATVAIVYDLRFEFGGTAVDESLVPANLRSITVDDEVPVTVQEVQTRVTKVR